MDYRFVKPVALRTLPILSPTIWDRSQARCSVVDTTASPLRQCLRRVGASRLDDCHGGNWEPRQVDGEDASPIRQVARIDPAIVRFDAPSAEGEAEAKAGSIGAALLERAEQFVDVPTRQTAAFVLDLDQHALGAGADR